MRSHPSDEELIHICLDRGLPASDAARRHVDSGCRRCRERLAELRRIAEVFSATPLSDVPEHLAAWAREWIAEQERKQPGARRAPNLRPARGRRVVDALEEIRAVLVFDTAGGAVLQGVRGGGDPHARQLLYESPGGNLHLQVTPLESGRYTLRGQFLPAGPEPAPESGRAILVRTARGNPRRLSETGGFEFDKVPSGRIQVQIEWGGRRVFTDPLNLGADG